MVIPDTVIVNIMACRVFRNLKLRRHSQVLIIPTQIDTGSLTQLDCVPGMDGRNSYHMGGTVNMPMSAEVSRWKEFSHRGLEKPNTHLGGVEVTKVIEFPPTQRQI